MFNSIVLNIKQERFNKYCEAFNFFQSKSINMIIGSRKLDYVIHYRDLEILDDETQYFKRYYSSTETATRLRKLINYYEINMTPPAPNLLPINTYHILEHRNKKIIKLCIMKEKSLARREEAEDNEEDSDHMILSQLDESNFSAVSSSKSEDSERKSFDSNPHNAYDVEQDQIRETDIQNKTKTFNLIYLKDIADSYFILDFKANQEEHHEPLQPHINIIPPVQIAPPIKVETASIGMQTLPIEIPVPLKKAEKEIKPMPIPQLKKQMAITPVSQMGLRSEIKNENNVLTESLDMLHRRHENERTKPSTFMEYYNSQPVKAPSNILERYIKRKK